MDNLLSDNNLFHFSRIINAKKTRCRSKSSDTDTDSESSEFSKLKRSRSRFVHFCTFVNIVYIPHHSESIDLWYGSRELKLFQTEAFQEAHLYAAYHQCTVKQAIVYLYQPSEILQFLT